MEISCSRQGDYVKRAGDVTFFFTEFSDNFKAKDRRNVFHKYGDVIEVVIANKRNKMGKRFGFVRFQHVRSPEQFETRLDNIIIVSQKIYVNTPRFRRQREVRWQRTSLQGQRVVNQDKPDWNQHLHEGGRSYANVVKSTKQGNQKVWKPKEDTNRSKEAFAHLNFKMEDSKMLRFWKAYVGQVTIAGMMHNIQEEFHRQGVFSVKVTLMGENLVLLEGQDDDEILSLISDAKDWMLTWFTEVRSWTPREVDNESLVWIRCYGVPVHAWSVDFLSTMVSLFGEFICVDECTNNGGNFDVAKILVRTKVCNLINRITKVQINEDAYSIKMMEEWYGPSYQGKWGRNGGWKRGSASSGSDSYVSEFDFPTGGVEGSPLEEEEFINEECNGEFNARAIVPYSLDFLATNGMLRGDKMITTRKIDFR